MTELDKLADRIAEILEVEPGTIGIQRSPERIILEPWQAEGLVNRIGLDPRLFASGEGGD